VAEKFKSLDNFEEGVCGISEIL